MNAEKLQQLLTQQEDAGLEFKGKVYGIDDSDGNIKRRQRDELIKDILSLANGNVSVVEEPRYLIIGANDKLSEDGTRELYDVGENALTLQRILQIVNPACDPPLEDIECDLVELQNKHILAITVWPSPHLYETTRELVTPQSTYNEHVVFIRRDENIGIASTKEREAIQKLKRMHFSETRKAPPIKFGALVGAICGGLAAIAPRDLAQQEKAVIVGKFAGGAFVGSFFGTLIGRFYTDIVQITYDWHFLSTPKRIVMAIFTVIVAISSWRVYKIFIEYIRRVVPNQISPDGRSDRV